MDTTISNQLFYQEPVVSLEIRGQLETDIGVKLSEEYLFKDFHIAFSLQGDTGGEKSLRKSRKYIS